MSLPDPLLYVQKKTFELIPVNSIFFSKLEIITDDFMRIEYGERVHRLATSVLADHIADDIYCGMTTSEWPKTTWQMFKYRNGHKWWLKWLVDRHPVEYAKDVQSVTIQVKRYLTYPESTVRMPKMGRPFIYETISEKHLS